MFLTRYKIIRGEYTSIMYNYHFVHVFNLLVIKSCISNTLQCCFMCIDCYTVYISNLIVLISSFFMQVDKIHLININKIYVLIVGIIEGGG